MRIAVRLGSGLAQLAGGPRLAVEVADGATVEDVLSRVAQERPAVAPGLPSALPVVRGTQVSGGRVLADGDEVALHHARGGRTGGSGMATLEVKAPAHEGHPTVFVDTFTNGVLGPCQAMLGPVADGGHIVVNTAPGCWGPMITPRLRGGHEVARPVAVAGAKVGDAIAIRIKDIVVTSMATASGNDYFVDGRYNGDPTAPSSAAECGTPYPRRGWRASGRTPCAARTAAPTPRRSSSPTATRSRSTRAAGSASRSTRRRPRRSPPTPPTTPRCRRTPSSTRSSRSPRTTWSASSPACARSWASSAPRRRPTCPTPTTRATSARS